MGEVTLYELTDEMLQLYQMLEDGEDPELINDTLEAVGGELQVKASGYCRVIRKLEASAKLYEAKKDALKDEMKFWTNKEKRAKDGVERLKERLKTVMEELGLTELPAEAFNLKIVNNGGVRAVRLLVDPGELPEKFQKIKIEADTAALRELLEDLEKEELTTSFAELEPRGTRLKIT